MTDTDYPGYRYQVTPIPNTVDVGCTGVSGGYNGCVEARIEVDWTNNGTGATDPTNTVIFSRFFSRY